MQTNIKIITVENTELEIHKFNFMKSLEVQDMLICTILKGNTSLSQDEKSGLEQLFQDLMQSGASKGTELQKAKALDKFKTQDGLSLVINLLRNSILNLSFKEKIAFIDTILSSVKLHNNKELVLSCEALNDVLTQGGSALKIVFEVLKYNFSFLSKDGKLSIPSN